ncbi:MAG TPA: transcriptional regulator [Ardenticatenaceae bacterium]|nr:transcriptional regulator [Ardenticatenaceae bacterium]
MKILSLLGEHFATINEIAQALDVPTSTATANVRILEASGLFETELRPTSTGLHKRVARTFDQVVVDLPTIEVAEPQHVEIDMPIGHYFDIKVRPTCGLASASGLIGFLDDPISFYDPEHMDADLLWFRAGYVEYRFPNRLPPGTSLKSVQVSMEACSEAPHHLNNWPSDITLWINGVEVGTWTSPGDFGGERGRLTPDWWEVRDTQFGLLKRWRVDAEGSFLDGTSVSGVTLDDLGLRNQTYIPVRIGVKLEAANQGGLNLFGSRFGNYGQGLMLRLSYEPRPASENRSGEMEVAIPAVDSLARARALV